MKRKYKAPDLHFWARLREEYIMKDNVTSLEATLLVADMEDDIPAIYDSENDQIELQLENFDITEYELESSSSPRPEEEHQYFYKYYIIPEEKALELIYTYYIQGHPAVQNFVKAHASLFRKAKLKLLDKGL